VVMRKKTARPFFMQLAAVQHAQKTTLWNFFTRRTMQSAIRLFVLDFLWDGGFFARTIRQSDDT
jgi:hypothetical protein